MKNLPFSEACERNKKPILDVLKDHLTQGQLIEMGFGTAQHCEFLSAQFSQIDWYACDHQDYHDIFRARISHENPRLHGPYTLWADELSFSEQCRLQNIPTSYDYFFSANTLHIMNALSVEYFCQHVGAILKESGLLFLYGPFRFSDRPFASSNQQFDEQLQARGVGSAIRSYEELASQLKQSSLASLRIIEMPANNHLLIFKKK